MLFSLILLGKHSSDLILLSKHNSHLILLGRRHSHQILVGKHLSLCTCSKLRNYFHVFPPYSYQLYMYEIENVVVSHIYIVLFSTLEQTHCTRM